MWSTKRAPSLSLWKTTAPVRILPRRLNLWIAGSAVIVGAVAESARAQITPIDPAQLVNTTTEGLQIAPDVARMSDGRFLVVWETLDQPPVDHGVFARYFSTSGDPVGPEFRVDAGPRNHYTYPKVATDDHGFVVVWNHSKDQIVHNVLGRAFTEDGSPIGPPFAIHQPDEPAPTAPDVAADPAGGYVAVWLAPHDGGMAIFGRKLGASGQPVGPAFPIATGPYSRLGGLDVDAFGPGQFILGYARQPGPGFGVYVRAFEADGELGEEIHVAEGYDDYGIIGLRLGAGSDGSAVVSWGNEIFHATWYRARLCSPSGEILADVDLGTAPDDVSVERARDGSWLLLSRLADDLVRGSLYSPQGELVGSPFDLASSWNLGVPVADFDVDSNPVLVGEWYEGGDASVDLYARRFRGFGLLLDGFESGDTTRWSATAPGPFRHEWTD